MCMKEKSAEFGVVIRRRLLQTGERENKNERNVKVKKKEGQKIKEGNKGNNNEKIANSDITHYHTHQSVNKG